jgi:activator of HSP90 ATPase
LYFDADKHQPQPNNAVANHFFLVYLKIHSTMKNFKKYFLISADPESVYLALTFEPTIMLWTGQNAVMKEEPQTEFSLWDESIVGLNLEFEKGKKIVQEWYFGNDESPSIVTIKLHPHKKGTSVELLHTNIPEEAFDDICEGWEQAYFGALIDFYEED